MEAIKAKPDFRHPFDAVRGKPIRFSKTRPRIPARWAREVLKYHFQVVRELFSRRVVQSGLGS